MKTFIVLQSLLLLLAGCNNDNSGENPEITGHMVKYSECGGFKSARIAAATPDSLSCIEYAFDQAGGKLEVYHRNSGFNCCPESLFCKVSLHLDTIVFSESEKKVGCKCNCLYDMQMEAEGIQAKQYWIRIVEPYAGSQEKLIFKVDLAKNGSGKYCVPRKNYPWRE